MFEPSQKQREAICKMESFSGVSSHRDDYDDLQSFQEYWDLLDKRCKRKKRHMQINSDPELKEKISKLRDAKIQAYYLDESHLFNYGKKYVDRYLPSHNKLRKKLQAKCKDLQLLDKVFLRLTKNIDEQKLAKVYASRGYLSGASAQKIKQSLYQKEFAKENIELVVGELFEEGAAARILSLERKVAALIKKNKSKFEIESNLRLQGPERDWLKEYLQDACGEDAERAQIEALYEKFARNEKDVKRVIKKITSKGFAYRLVADVVKNLQEFEGD